MELKDLQVNTLVRIVNSTFVTKNFDSTHNGYICKNTKKYLSSDMMSSIIGKDLPVQSIDADDPVLNVKVAGFWIPLLWIEKLAPKPKVVRLKAGAVPDTAIDGKPFGSLFKVLLQKFPDIGVLSTNRFTQLTDDEFNLVCSKLGINHMSNKTDTARAVVEKLMEFVPKTE